jgi:gliding motility-associated-like protein
MTQMLIRKIFILFLIYFCSNNNTFATHIIGGELTYTCLGNNRYQVLLTVYRDCYYGRPKFDDPAYIAIYSNDNILLDTIIIPFRDSIKLDPKLSDTCLVIPPDVCVSTTTYMDTVTLPFRPGGYILAYQRCCRNNTIKNLVKPLETGATFSIVITEDALNSCNSSAKFKEWPPIYICVNRPILFDQSAIDIDGDSVFYRLCTPLTSPDTIAQPRPAFKPPYGEVVWRPPYGLSNLLGGDPLKIDPKTGFLTGTPNTIGQFVVGICLEEFRKGVLISTTRRDFQFNVGVCGSSVSSIFAPQIVCDEATVFFNNQSLNSNTYFWDFGVEGIASDTSNKFEPAYAYPDTGKYTIRLITQPNSACADTSFHTVHLKLSSLVPNFFWEELECRDSFIIKLTNKTVDSLGKAILGYRWEIFYDNIDTIRSSLKDPTFYLNKSGVWTIRLTAIAENGCEKTFEANISANLVDFNLPDTVSACVGRLVQLNPQPDNSLIYEWSPPSSFSNPKAAQQQVTVTDNSQLYSVLIFNGQCYKTDTVWVVKDKTTPNIVATAKPDTIRYGKTTQLDATTLPTTFKYNWEPANSLSNPRIANPFAQPTATTTYTLTVTPPNSTCISTAQVRVVVIVPDCEEPNIFLPNAFTPNDDGNNDVLQVRGTIIGELKLIIYNRWGEKVFETVEIGGGWDGYFNNSPCAPDVYGYYLEVLCVNGEKFIKKGNINLIR